MTRIPQGTGLSVRTGEVAEEIPGTSKNTDSRVHIEVTNHILLTPFPANPLPKQTEP